MWGFGFRVLGCKVKGAPVIPKERLRERVSWRLHGHLRSFEDPMLVFRVEGFRGKGV